MLALPTSNIRYISSRKMYIMPHSVYACSRRSPSDFNFLTKRNKRAEERRKMKTSGQKMKLIIGWDGEQKIIMGARQSVITG